MSYKTINYIDIENNSFGLTVSNVPLKNGYPKYAVSQTIMPVTQFSNENYQSTTRPDLLEKLNNPNSNTAMTLDMISSNVVLGFNDNDFDLPNNTQFSDLPKSQQTKLLNDKFRDDLAKINKEISYKGKLGVVGKYFNDLFDKNEKCNDDYGQKIKDYRYTAQHWQDTSFPDKYKYVYDDIDSEIDPSYHGKSGYADQFNSHINTKINTFVVKANDCANVSKGLGTSLKDTEIKQMEKMARDCIPFETMKKTLDDNFYNSKRHTNGTIFEDDAEEIYNQHIEDNKTETTCCLKAMCNPCKYKYKKGN